MKITYSFDSLKDLSDVSKGEQFLDILVSNGLIIDKVGKFEPIRTQFLVDNFPDMWKGEGINEHSVSTCYFLFKGTKNIQFSGMVTWSLNLPPNSKSINAVSLWLNIPTKYDINNLIKLGDDIFEWCEAVYGYISEDSKSTVTTVTGGIQYGLSGLMWVNYFGEPYIKESDFHLPSNHIPINHGVKVILADTPNDEKLIDPNFIEPIKNEIGLEWFWHKPRKFKKRVPFFDRSEIERQ